MHVCNVPLDFFFYILYPQPQSDYILRSQDLLYAYYSSGQKSVSGMCEINPV